MPPADKHFLKLLRNAIALKMHLNAAEAVMNEEEERDFRQDATTRGTRRTHGKYYYHGF